MSYSPPVHVRRAFAKVNLALAVDPPIPAGQPNAGYHPICSWMHAIDLWDDVSARPLAPGDTTRVSVVWAPEAPRPTPIDWPIAKDLAARAHDALESGIGRALPVELQVRKRIPVGAGLGGGSSDAAATLLLLNEVFGLGLGVDRLAAIGHRLGSDVPFFVDSSDPPRPAIVSGLGERIERTRHATGDVLLVVPPFGCDTRAVYGAFDRLAQADAKGIEHGEPVIRHAAAHGQAAGALFNDLERAARQVEPRLGALRARGVGAVDARAHMTGSGSALFLLDRAASAESHRRLADALPEVVLIRARLV